MRGGILKRARKSALESGPSPLILSPNRGKGQHGVEIIRCALE